MVPDQTTIWKLHSLQKGSRKSIYKSINENHFENSKSGILERWLRHMYIEPKDIYISMRLASSLLVSPSIRNMVWDITTLSFLSQERLNKVNDQEHTKECLACGNIASTQHLFHACELTMSIMTLHRRQLGRQISRKLRGLKSTS